ncbi:YD repeat [Methylocaldum marinum]|uniref:YD repeat n=1 Tax=Methylocaldum marinum TaxID=1432792 RepID=A0A250KYQ0_9GAMM|nr:RHS repeat-associated core domain-containing protein [Methylocaldum marinum]BBA36808.1 YD repeat [Methylocaldum marinum]
MYEAARLGDGVEHTSALAGFLIGALLGVALIATVAFATFTCGFGAVLLAGLAAGIGASAILSASEAIGRAMSSRAGAITRGSPNVFINGRAAAFVQRSTVSCGRDSPQQVMAEGSGNVYINGLPAVRRGDSTTCDGKVAEHSNNVHIGGGRVQYLPIAREVPDWLRTAVDWTFALAGLVGGLAGMIRAAGGASVRALAPCAAKYVAGFVAGEAAGRYLLGPAVDRVVGGLIGHPVQIAGGQKLLLAHDETDFALIAPLPLTAARFYSSALDDGSALGRGWRLPWEISLAVGEDHVTYTDAQGRAIVFPRVPRGEKLFAPAEQLFLGHLRDGRWVISDLAERHYAFSPAPPGSPTTHQLTRIEDNRANAIVLERDATGTPVALTDTVGHRLALHYAAIGDQGPRRLIAIERLAGGPVATLVRYAYDAQGRLIAVRDALDRVTRRFAWGDTGAEAGLMIAHRNALGLTGRYRWETIDGQPRVVEHTTGDGEHYRFQYDVAARRAIAADLGDPENPLEAHWTWDDHRQITAYHDFDGRRYAMAYDAGGHLVRLDLPGDPESPRTVRFEYDALGRIVAETDPEGLRTERSFAPDSLRLQSETGPDGSTWQAVYEPHCGVLLQTIDALGHKTEYTWEHLRGPSIITDPQGHTVRLDWDARGQLQARTDCSGKTRRYAYDEAGRLIAETDALGRTTRYTLDALGQVLAVTHPDGRREGFVWDALGQLIRHTDSAGHTQIWQRDARGRVLCHTDAEGRTLHARYNARQQLDELRRGDSRYRFRYDPVGRLVAEQRPDGLEIHLRYAAAGTLARRDERGSGPEQPVRSRRYDYDRNGRLTAQHDATATTRYTWTPGGQLDSARRIPTEKGMVLGLTEDSVRFTYDALGRLLTETGAAGELARDWDSLSNLRSLTLPQGQTLGYLRYGSGHVHGITFDGAEIVQFERDDLHREVLRRQGALTTCSGYDARGRLSWQGVTVGDPRRTDTLDPDALIGRRYAYTDAGELDCIHDCRRGDSRYHYDRAGRLTQAGTLSPTLGYSQERFAWDAADNLVQLGDPPVPGNRLGTWRGHRGEALRYAYDPFGRLTAKHTPAGVQRFTWDDQDQLIAVEDGRGITRFAYDPLGRRTAKWHEPKSPGRYIGDPHTPGKTRFVWEGLRLLQAITEDARGTQVRTWAYDPAGGSGYTPIAAIDQGLGPDREVGPPMVYPVHTDHLGTPQELTDADGRIAWSARYSAWGGRRGPVLLEADRPTPFATDCPLRYPGQYADDETGLHYNTFRYYDPEIGRFISPDPVGLAGGFNLYQYAPNPVSWVDPLGWVHESTPGYNVYGLFDKVANEPYYVGITDDLARRRAEHLKSGRLSYGTELRPLDRNVMYGQARGFEQAYIEHYGTKTGVIGEEISSSNRGNKVNSFDHGSTARSPTRQANFESHYQSKTNSLTGGC